MIELAFLSVVLRDRTGELCHLFLLSYQYFRVLPNYNPRIGSHNYH